MNTPNDPMAEIRASFFIECEELLEALQDGLQCIDDGTSDSETINVVFRAVHSIKGGAGAFGLDGLVRFAHRFETVLDEVRAGRMEVHPEALKVFFLGADHLNDLVRVSRDGSPLPEAQTAALLVQLDVYLGEKASGENTPEEEIEFVPTGLVLDLDLDLDFRSDDDGDAPDMAAPLELPPMPPLDRSFDPTKSRYNITFIPNAELFETGNDPCLLLRNLEMLGDAEVHCDASQVPDIETLTPEVPHLGWQIILETHVEETEIASLFEFVDGLCILEIVKEGSAKLAPMPALPTPAPMQETVVDPAAIETAPPPAEIAKVPAAPSVTPTAPVPPPTTAKAQGNAARSVVRVDLDRIERLVNLVGELVINQAMLSQSLEKSGLSPHSDAMNGLEEFQRLTRDIQDSVMMIRAQPVKSLFQRMSRIVRECSSAVGKDVRLRTEGEGTEVDKTVIERLADPLTHMIRNAVDHGLETTVERLKAGKSAQGMVTLTATHRSGRVVIEVSDDGNGINREKVLQIAINKGLMPADAQLNNSEIDNLLFLPGFSTAEQVSDLSGRGVGMDVVRTEIQALGGRVVITSEPGAGTCFSISLPLTLAVLDGMVIEVASETLVLPLNLVIETLTLEHGDVEMLRPGRLLVRVRGEFVPMIDLGAELGYRNALEDVQGAVVLLIAHEDGNRAALMIDNIVDQRQVVIKGLDDSFYRAPGVAAATILGDGQIALILDPSDIIAQALTPPHSISSAVTEGISA